VAATSGLGSLALILLMAAPAAAEVTMDPLDDRGRVVIGGPESPLSSQEERRLDRLRSLSTGALPLRRLAARMARRQSRLCLAAPLRRRPVVSEIGCVLAA
jgi:hypothetical protein